MSKLNINRNIFLEKEELLRFQQFVGLDSLSNQVLIDNTTKWGIVRTSFDANYVDFKVEVGGNLGTIKIANLSKAVDKNKNLIKQIPIDNFAVTNDSLWYWVKISHNYNYIEEGQCSVNTNGSVTGVNTKFLEVLRGQSTEVPVKIKFYKSGGVTNNQIYEIASVTNDTGLVLVGSSFVSESGLNYIVVGSTPIGEVLTNEQKVGLYWYDSCNLELILEESTDVAPVTNYAPEEDFYIARVRNVAGTVTIQDKRGDQYLTFNVEGVADKLDKYLNLSDLTNTAAARANLGVSTSAEIEAAFFADSGWQVMTRNSSVISATGFDVKIRRIGKNICITGKFRCAGTMAATGNLLFSIPWTSIGGNTAKPTVRIFDQVQMISTENNNHGIQIYVDETETAYLAIKAGETSYVPSDLFNRPLYFTLNYLTQ